jgi:hypothetical protein
MTRSQIGEQVGGIEGAGNALECVAPDGLTHSLNGEKPNGWVSVIKDGATHPFISLSMVGINFERGKRRNSGFESAVTFIQSKSLWSIVYVLQGAV